MAGRGIATHAKQISGLAGVQLTRWAAGHLILGHNFRPHCCNAGTHELAGQVAKCHLVTLMTAAKSLIVLTVVYSNVTAVNHLHLDACATAREGNIAV